MKLKETIVPNTSILGFKDSDHNPTGIVALVQIDQCDKSVCYEIELNLKYMGMSEESEYEMELTKDFMRSCRNYYWKFRKIPAKEELKWMVERYWYGLDKYANEVPPIYKHQRAPTINLRKWFFSSDD